MSDYKKREEIEIVVQKQLEAYNNRDLDKFLSYYAQDIQLYNFEERAPFVNGIEDLKKIYSDVFDNSPNLNATIKNRMMFENKVIDEEVVTGRKGVEYNKVIVIYEVNLELIEKVTFIRKK